MPVVVNDPGLEALLVQMALSAVPLVESLCIQAVQPMHARGELVELDFDEDVEVGPHLHPAVDSPAEEPGDLRE